LGKKVKFAAILDRAGAVDLTQAGRVILPLRLGCLGSELLDDLKKS
jgi:hypothetical protein